jgi:hypothetical protein
MREKWLIYVLVVLMAVMAAVFGIRYFKRKAPPQTTQASQSVPVPIAKIPEAAKSFCTPPMTELLMNRTYVVGNIAVPLKFKRGAFNGHEGGNIVRAGFIGPKKGEITSACGDLSGSSSQDNIVAFDVNDGGSYTLIYIVPVFVQDGQLRNGEPFLLGDRVAVGHITITDHILVIDYTGHGPNTGLCCPDTAKTVHLKLIGNKLVCADKACKSTMQFD